MANVRYNAGREGILDESIRLRSGSIAVMLVTEDYRFSAQHKFVSDLGPVDNGRSDALMEKSFHDGVFDAADTTLMAIAERRCNALIIFESTANDRTSRLIAYIDTAGSGLPITPVSNRIVEIEFDNGPDKIFRA